LHDPSSDLTNLTALEVLLSIAGGKFDLDGKHINTKEYQIKTISRMTPHRKKANLASWGLIQQFCLQDG
jgi:hypothetical protein